MTEDHGEILHKIDTAVELLSERLNTSLERQEGHSRELYGDGSRNRPGLVSTVQRHDIHLDASRVWAGRAWKAIIGIGTAVVAHILFVVFKK